MVQTTRRTRRMPPSGGRSRRFWRGGEEAKSATQASCPGLYGAAQIGLPGAPMADDHPTPHFHNDLGAPVIKVGVKEFMCIGARPPFDHPHIFIDMGDADETVCP